MPLSKINDRLWIGPQPAVGDFPSYKEKGFGTLVNLRPEGEEPGQPGNRAERTACEQAGIDYHFIPVSMGSITEADIQAFQQVMANAKGPVLAHCKSGTRALLLHALGEVLDGQMRGAELLDFGRSHGFDLAAADAWMKRHSARRPEVRGFFDHRTWSVQYVVSDHDTGKCAIIDPVLDFDEKSGMTATKSADSILAYIKERGLAVEWILDTHPHADHFSAAHYLKQKTGAPTAIGDHVVEVQKLWKTIYNLPDLATDGSQWDALFADGQEFSVGSIKARVMFSPGHTLASITYVIGDAAFVHDTLFQPDSGTARADFPGGNALALWNSIRNILALPAETRLFTGHDYQPDGRNPRWESTVAEQWRSNPHLVEVDEAAFVQLRTARDKTLSMPKLILHALQVNIRGGRLPEPEANGRRYLKFPLDALEGATW